MTQLSLEPVHEISNDGVCATSNGVCATSSLIRAFARRLSIL